MNQVHKPGCEPENGYLHNLRPSESLQATLTYDLLCISWLSTSFVSIGRAFLPGTWNERTYVIGFGRKSFLARTLKPAFSLVVHIRSNVLILFLNLFSLVYVKCDVAASVLCTNQIDTVLAQTKISVPSAHMGRFSIIS